MEDNTRLYFSKLQAAMAKFHGRPSVETTFSVAAPQTTAIIGAIQQTSNFLNRITMRVVPGQTGRVVAVGVSKTIMSRTDTSGGAKRKGRRLNPASERTFFCNQTNFDVELTYAEMDMWALMPEFHKEAMKAVNEGRANDIIKAGWYGTADTATTNPDTNTLCQDVAKGWLQILRDEKPENLITEIEAASGKVTIGAAGDYKNIDQLAAALYSQIPVEHRTGKEEIFVGTNLIADRDDKLLSAIDKPTEDVANKTNNVTGQRATIAGLKFSTPEFFPDNGILVTDPANLHYYVQKGMMRKKLTDTPESDCVTDWMSANIDYQIGNPEAIVGVEPSSVELV